MKHVLAALVGSLLVVACGGVSPDDETVLPDETDDVSDVVELQEVPPLAGHAGYGSEGTWSEQAQDYGSEGSLFDEQPKLRILPSEGGAAGGGGSS